MPERNESAEGPPQPPRVLDGLKGILLELRYVLTVTARCPNCGSSWNGWYPKAHMDYCHHCGTELIHP